MHTRTILVAAAMLAAGALLGGLAGSGRLMADARAGDKPAAAEQKPPAGFPASDEVQRSSCCGGCG